MAGAEPSCQSAGADARRGGARLPGSHWVLSAEGLQRGWALSPRESLQRVKGGGENLDTRVSRLYGLWKMALVKCTAPGARNRS